MSTMDYARYIDRLRRLGETLQNDPSFRPLVEIERPFSASEFSELEESMARAGLEGVKIWKEFRAFYGVANGFLFQWLYEGPKAVTTKSGSAQIAMVQEIYLPEHLSPAQVKVFHEQRIAIDRMSPNYQVAVLFHKDSEKPELYYFSDETGDYHRLTLDFQGYLEMLLEARAMFKWQEFFVGDPSFPLSREDAEAFRRSLKAIFPDADVSRFKSPGDR